MTDAAVWGIVVAAGAGTRFGGPKLEAPLHGRRVIDWALATACGVCDGVVVVVPADRAGMAVEDVVCVVGGDTRSASVRNGLGAVPAEAEIVVVHDAARPLANAGLWRAAIDAVRGGADGAVCAVPVSDTIRTVGGETLDRASLLAVQTPQAFRASILRDAHAGGGEATDDAALVEAAGGTVVVVPGSPRNIKITHPHDLLVAEALLSGDSRDGGE